MVTTKSQRGAIRPMLLDD